MDAAPDHCADRAPRCNALRTRSLASMQPSMPPSIQPSIQPSMQRCAAARSPSGAMRLCRIHAMCPSEPVARFATHASTLVGSETVPTAAEPPIASGSGPLFRPAEPIHGPSLMDLRVRRQLWWLSLVIPALCVAVVASSALLDGPAVTRRLLF